MSLPPRGLFVTGTDTGIGKTTVATALVATLRAQGVRTGAYKPVVSGSVVGADGTERWDDVEKLAVALGGFHGKGLHGAEMGTIDDHLRNRISPQRFVAPMAPPYAALVEGRSVDERLLIEGARAWTDACELLIVEGAGGLLSPVSPTRDNADLAGVFGYPLVVVARAGLGPINHTRLTVDAARARGLNVAAVMLVESRRGAGVEFDDPSVAHNRVDLARRFPDVVVEGLPYRPDGDLRNALTSLKINWLVLSGFREGA
jgi:dethiobiotin synthetase